MTEKVIEVQEPALDDRGWVVRTQERIGGAVSEQLHWFEDEIAAETAYHRFLSRCKLAAAAS